MAAGNKPVRELMQDVRAVDWLPLNAAVERLSRSHEQAFLANVGPIALKAASVAEAARRKAKQPAPEKRRARRVTPPPAVPAPEMPAAATLVSEPAPEVFPSIPVELPVGLSTPAHDMMQSAAEEQVADSVQDELAAAMNEALEPDASADTAESEIIAALAEPGADDVVPMESTESAAGNPIGSLVQKLRHWLRRAA